MLTHVKTAAIFALLLLCIYLSGQISTLQSSLKETKDSLELANGELEDAIDEIDEQNAKIREFNLVSREKTQDKIEKVRVIYRDLPTQIAADTADPADADSLNLWMSDLFEVTPSE